MLYLIQEKNRLLFSRSNTTDPINVIHLDGQLMQVENFLQLLNKFFL